MLAPFVANENDHRVEFVAFDAAGDADEPWVLEAANFVSFHVLHKTEHCLGFRADDGRLAAVAAFDRRTIALPFPGLEAVSGWHLQVVAVRADLQNQHLADEVFAAVFAHMKHIDPARTLLTANVHRDNEPSRRACARHGVTYLRPLDDDYNVLLGDVPAE